MRRATHIVVLAACALLVAYDIVAYVAGGVESTISRVLLFWASEIPIIMLVPGVIIGHLFWPQPRPSGQGESDSLRAEGDPPPP